MDTGAQPVISGANGVCAGDPDRCCTLGLAQEAGTASEAVATGRKAFRSSTRRRYPPWRRRLAPAYEIKRTWIALPVAGLRSCTCASALLCSRPLRTARGGRCSHPCHGGRKHFNLSFRPPQPGGWEVPGTDTEHSCHRRFSQSLCCRDTLRLPTHSRAGCKGPSVAICKGRGVNRRCRNHELSSGRIGVVPVAILPLDSPVSAVDGKLCALIIADLATSIDGFALRFEMPAATGCIVPLDVPTASLGIRDDAM